MQFLILTYSALALLGFNLGYFLPTNAVIIISVITLGITGLRFATKREIEQVFAYFVFLCALILNIAMWITWCIVNKGTAIKSFLINILK